MAAWIESHQTIWEHPKTRKAARALDITVVQLVGHLHSLWHWAIDHAEDGNLSKYDRDDIALAARWDGDADAFVQALIDCGPGDTAGYLEPGGPYGPPDQQATGELVLHDWWGYAGRLIVQRRTAREAGAHGNHIKYGVTDPNCTRCTASGSGGDSGGESGGDSGPDRVSDRTEPHLTIPNPTTPNPTPSNTRGDPSSQSRRHDSPPASRDPAPDRPDPNVSDDARELTRRLARAIKANGHTIPKAGTKAHRDWLTEMDRLLRLGPPGGEDQPTPADEIAFVIDWATSNSFWRAHVRSVPKFREKFSQLRLQAIHETETKSPSSNGDTAWDAARRVQQQRQAQP